MENTYFELSGGAKKKHKGCKDPQKECVPNQSAFESTGRRSCSPKKLSELTIKDIQHGRDLCQCDQKTTRCKKTSRFTEDFSFGRKKTITQKSAEKAKKKSEAAKLAKVAKVAKATKASGKTKTPKTPKVVKKKCLDSDYLCGKPTGKFKCQFLVKDNLDKKSKIQARKDCICNPDTHKCLSTSSLKGQTIMNEKIDRKATVLKLDIEKKYRIAMQKALRTNTLTKDVKQSIRLEVANQLADYTADIEAKRLATLAVLHRKSAPASVSRLLKIQKRMKKLVKKGDNSKKIEVSLHIDSYLSGICRKIIQIFSKLLKVYGIKIVGFNTSGTSGRDIITKFLSILKTFYQSLTAEQEYLKPVLRFVFEQGAMIQDSLKDIDKKKISYLCYAAFVTSCLQDTPDTTGTGKKRLEQKFSDSQRNFVAVSYSLEKLTESLEDIYQFAGQDLEKLNDAILDFKFANYGNIMMLKSGQSSPTLETRSKTKTSVQKLETKIQKSLTKGLQKVETGASSGKKLTKNLGSKIERFLQDSTRDAEKETKESIEIIEDAVQNVSTEISQAIEVVATDSEKAVEKGALTIGKITKKTESIVKKLVEKVMEYVSDGIQKIHLTTSKPEAHKEFPPSKDVQNKIVKNVKGGVERGIGAVQEGTHTVLEVSENIGSRVEKDIQKGLHVSEEVARTTGNKIANLTKEVLKEIKQGIEIGGEKAVSLVDRISQTTKQIIGDVVDGLDQEKKKISKVDNIQIDETASKEEQRRSIYESLAKKITDIETLKRNVLLCKDGTFQLQIQQEYLKSIADFLKASPEATLRNLFVSNDTDYLETLESKYAEDGATQLGKPPRAVILEELLQHIEKTVLPEINQSKVSEKASDVPFDREQFVNFLTNNKEKGFSLQAGISAIDSYFTTENYKVFEDTIRKLEVIQKLKAEEEKKNISIYKIKAQYELLEDISTHIDDIQSKYIDEVFKHKSGFDKALIQYNQTEPLPQVESQKETIVEKTSSEFETETDAESDADTTDQSADEDEDVKDEEE